MSDENKNDQPIPYLESQSGVRISTTSTATSKDGISPEPRPVIAPQTWWIPLIVVGVGGGLAAAIPFVTGPALIVVQVALGVLGAVAGALGIASGGVRK